MKPIILITGGIPVKSDANQIWSLNRDYADAISRAGGVPLLALDENSVGAYAQIADGLLLSGGRDVSPALYNREPKTDLVITEPKRDALEWKILEVFAARKKPIFGICRGLQMMNVYFGGDVISGHTIRTGRQSFQWRESYADNKKGIRSGQDIRRKHVY